MKITFGSFGILIASEDIRLRFEDKVAKIQQGDDLLPTVMKVVKVFELRELILLTKMDLEFSQN